ncbi:MAG: universal stress protein [Gemmatimonadetes bacterium]|nr:universal stress protein [Gemmatimonadota bacterium]NNK64936.1 universal stress protein [Gemmatimonadota bacterium]
MHQSIVVPLDGTTFAERALGPAARIAAATGASLHLVRVTDPTGAVRAYPAEGIGLPPTPVDPVTRSEDAARYLDRVGARVEASGVEDVRTAVLDGDVAPSVARYLAHVGADGLAIATHAPGPVGRVLSGSVADDLLAAVRLPVLAIPPAPDGHGDETRDTDEVAADAGAAPSLTPILVAIDGSTSDTAADTAGALTLALGGRLALVHVVSMETFAVGPLSHPTRAWDEAMRAGERVVDRVRERMRRRGIAVDAFVLAHRSPATAIREVAHEVRAGLVALGSHRRTGLRRLLLGSVANDVLTRVCRPVLVHPAC